MTELELYKFTEGKEVHWEGDKLLLWVDGEDLREFSEVEGDNIVEDGGFDIYLVHHGKLCMNLSQVCDLHGIEPTNILEKETNQ